MAERLEAARQWVRGKGLPDFWALRVDFDQSYVSILWQGLVLEPHTGHAWRGLAFILLIMGTRCGLRLLHCGRIV